MKGGGKGQEGRERVRGGRVRGGRRRERGWEKEGGQRKEVCRSRGEGGGKEGGEGGGRKEWRWRRGTRKQTRLP